MSLESPGINCDSMTVFKALKSGLGTLEIHGAALVDLEKVSPGSQVTRAYKGFTG